MKIPDTSKNPQPHWLMGGNPDAIEAQEAQGQKHLVESEQLPVEGTIGHEEAWEAIGVKLLPVEGDNIFRGAVLPDGWKKVATGHSMWSKLVDENGVERAGIFYKAAFYDRQARVRLTQRYSYEQDYDAPDNVLRWVVKDTCSENPIHIVEHPAPSQKTDVDGYYAKLRAVESEFGYGGSCEAWLKTNYPDYRNPAAYWDTAETP